MCGYYVPIYLFRYNESIFIDETLPEGFQISFLKFRNPKHCQNLCTFAFWVLLLELKWITDKLFKTLSGFDNRGWNKYEGASACKTRLRNQMPESPTSFASFQNYLRLMKTIYCNMHSNIWARQRVSAKRYIVKRKVFYGKVFHNIGPRARIDKRAKWMRSLRKGNN